MVLTEETLGINLVNFLRARRTCRKPAIFGNDFNSSNWIAVSRSGGQNLPDRLAGNFSSANVGRRQSCQSNFLFRRGGSVDAFVNWISQLVCEFAINFAGIFAHARGDFRGKQTRNDSVFIRGPYAAVAPEKGRTGAFLAAKTQPAGDQSFDKKLKAHRNFIKPSPQASADAIDHA